MSGFPKTEDQITAAAAWWANALRNPRFQDVRPGDPDPHGVFASVIANAGAYAMRMGTPEFDGLVSAFENALAEGLRTNEQIAGLSCDYDPDLVLESAARQAGFEDIGKFLFPWKTNMWFGADGSLTVASGYGEPIQVLIQPKTEEKS